MVFICFYCFSFDLWLFVVSGCFVVVIVICLLLISFGFSFVACLVGVLYCLQFVCVVRVFDYVCFAIGW